MADGSASSVIMTPSTSAAPSTAGSVPVPKLPLAIRKNVRDNFEAVKPDLERDISALLDAPWKIEVDPGMLYAHAVERYAKESFGEMLTEYIQNAIVQLKKFKDNYASDGIKELNYLASAHVLSIAPTANKEVEYTDCEITNGMLVLVFSKDNLGVNVYSSADHIDDALDKAGIAMNDDDVSKMRFHAKAGIREHWDAKAGDLKARLQKSLNLPVLELIPNFESNYAKLAVYKPTNYDFPKDFYKSFGQVTYEYFISFADNIEEAGFPRDSMMQEAFQDGVEKNEIGLRVVDKTKKEDAYCETIVENGCCWMQMQDANWRVNVQDIARDLVDQL